MLNLGYQINDVIVSLMGGQKPMTVFAQQGAQIGQIAASSGVGLRGMAASLVALAAPFLPIIALVGAAVGGFLLFDRAVSKGVDTKAMIAGLGLTRDEIKKLENTTVTSGDVIKATFQVIAQRVGFDMGNVKQYFSDALDFMTKLGRLTLAGIYAEFVGTFRAVSAVVQAGFSGKGIDGMLAAAGDAYTGAFNEANGALKRFGTDVEKQIGSNKLKDLRKQANEIKLDRPEKTDKHAEQLLREAEAVEAQIRNLYELADAYGVSGAAALIAEARVKAESAAIKGRADIEEMVERQIRLSIAERVKSAAAGAAAMRDEAAIQQQVNDSVRAGITPAAQAGELLRDRIADLSLLAAVEAAQQVSGQKGINATAAATRALDEQRAARVALTDAQKQASLLAARDGANESLALAKEELRLIGATDEARARALATMKATQEAARIGWGGKDAADYVKTMGDVAAQAVINAQAQDAYNASLTQTADEWDIIANKVASAARGMADAFGASGRAIGEVAAIFADYQAQRTRAEAVHNAEVTKAGNNQIKLAIENRRYALQSSGAQVAAYGDMVGAAKGFFKEGSKGYQALAAAEKVYRVAQFAMSLQAMIQNAAETLGFVANSTARSAAAGAEGIATQSKLPFPANIAAMAATAAALVAAGIAVVGGGGGAGGASGRPVSNTGTGSVLGDPEAKSESIKNAIDALREVDLLQNSYSRQMAASLRSIDNQIGGVASLVARSGDINANAGVTEGFKMNGFGSLLSKIPLIGGILGGLFGSKTTVTGSGLYGGAQSVGSILDGGFDASYYSDIQKKKKFFGITTGTSYSTQYSGADPNLENQFSLILRSFNDAIAAAAVPLGRIDARYPEPLAQLRGRYRPHRSAGSLGHRDPRKAVGGVRQGGGRHGKRRLPGPSAIPEGWRGPVRNARPRCIHCRGRHHGARPNGRRGTPTQHRRQAGPCRPVRQHQRLHQRGRLVFRGVLHFGRAGRGEDGAVHEGVRQPRRVDAFVAGRVPGARRGPEPQHGGGSGDLCHAAPARPCVRRSASVDGGRQERGRHRERAQRSPAPATPAARRHRGYSCARSGEGRSQQPRSATADLGHAGRAGSGEDRSGARGRVEVGRRYDHDRDQAHSGAERHGDWRRLCPDAEPVQRCEHRGPRRRSGCR
ncbi:phage tail length tape measure family protein [Sphingomonas aliaeris]|nr:phage tail length tape measure family protein [Sphingomonas aliaeris]